MEGGDALLLSPRQPDVGVQGFRFGRGPNDFFAMQGRPEGPSDNTNAAGTASAAPSGAAGATAESEPLEAQGPMAPGAGAPALPLDPLRAVKRAVGSSVFESQSARRAPFQGTGGEGGGAGPSRSSAGSRARAMLDRYKHSVASKKGDILPTVRYD